VPDAGDGVQGTARRTRWARLRRWLAIGGTSIAPVCLGGCWACVDANFTMSPNPALTGQTVTFDASSTDYNSGENCYGSSPTYTWDLDGDGQFDDASGEVVRRSYANPGTYDIGLHAFLCSSASDTERKTLVVAGLPQSRGARNTAPPGIAGQAREGETLTATTGEWRGARDLSYSYRWLRCDGAGDACVEIAGATARELKVTAADVNRTLRVRVTAATRGGKRVSATSSATGVVSRTPASEAPAGSGAPAPATPPTEGLPSPGETLDPVCETAEGLTDVEVPAVCDER
jgi:hypothetical protein